MSSFSENGLFGALFGRGAVEVGDDAWLQAMLDTEAALVRAAERAGLAPAGSGAVVTSVARAELFDSKALSEQAARTGNPVPALVRALTGLLPSSAHDTAEAIHAGATSQDVIDTAAMLITRRAIAAIGADLTAAAASCATLASTHVGTVMAGRTLLQQAVPVTFGLVAAGWLVSIDEARCGLGRIGAQRLAVQFGGAAGTLASLGDRGPDVAELLAEELDLPVPVLPWHTGRLRVIEIAAALAGVCAVLGKVGRDVTLLAQSEIAEVREGSGAGRGGSSAMPHKQNPVAAIVLLGCAKQAPGLLATLAAAGEQELQRAAGAWHAEWEPLSDLLRLTGSAASWAADLLGGLEGVAARMRRYLVVAGGLPRAEHVAAVRAPAMGRLAAPAQVARARARAGLDNAGLERALLDDSVRAELETAGIGADQIRHALRPESYLGAAHEFVRRALAAHAADQNPPERA